MSKGMQNIIEAMKFHGINVVSVCISGKACPKMLIFKITFSASFATMSHTSLQFKIRIRVWLQNNEHVQAILKP